jgi:hypothetical protein
LVCLLFLRSDNHGTRDERRDVSLPKTRRIHPLKMKTCTFASGMRILHCFPLRLAQIIFPPLLLSLKAREIVWLRLSDVARVNRKRNGCLSWLSSPVVVKNFQLKQRMEEKEKRPNAPKTHFLFLPCVTCAISSVLLLLFR